MYRVNRRESRAVDTALREKNTADSERNNRGRVSRLFKGSDDDDRARSAQQRYRKAMDSLRDTQARMRKCEGEITRLDERIQDIKGQLAALNTAEKRAVVKASAEAYTPPPGAVDVSSFLPEFTLPGSQPQGYDIPSSEGHEPIPDQDLGL